MEDKERKYMRNTIYSTGAADAVLIKGNIYT